VSCRSAGREEENADGGEHPAIAAHEGVAPEYGQPAVHKTPASYADEVRAFGQSKSGLVARQFVLSLVQTADGLPIAHEVHPGNIAEAKTLLPMIKSLLARYPLKRVVLVADRGLLNVNNLDELEQLQATLAHSGRTVRLEYILAEPAARYGEFADALRAMAVEQPADRPWVGQATWHKRRLVVAHDPEVAARRAQARNSAIQELLKLGQQWSGKLDAQDAGTRRRGRHDHDPVADVAHDTEVMTDEQVRQPQFSIAASTPVGGPVQAAAKRIASGSPDAVILGISGMDAVNLIRALAAAGSGSRPTYFARSLVGSKLLAEQLGSLAHGIVVSQLVPSPFKPKAPVTREYVKLLRQRDKNAGPSFIEFEGFLNAKVVMILALERAGPNATRKRLLETLTHPGRVDLGGYSLDFSDPRRVGSLRRLDAYFSDRGRLFQADRSRHFSVIMVDHGAR
jgi:hypothetical protein